MLPVSVERRGGVIIELTEVKSSSLELSCPDVSIWDAPNKSEVVA